jgi:DnaJ-class molecular chaperone
MRKGKIYNHSKCKMEFGEQKICPRCDGFGSTAQDGIRCSICRGIGIVWLSKSGWTRPIYGRVGIEENLY